MLSQRREINFWEVYHILRLPVVIDLAIGNNGNVEGVFSAGPCSKYFLSPNTMDANNPSRRSQLCGASCDKRTGRGRTARGRQHQETSPRV